MRKIKHIILLLLVFSLLLCSCSTLESNSSHTDLSEMNTELVIAPSAEYVIACLNNVETITGIELGDRSDSKALSSSGLDNATATIFFSCSLVEETDTSRSVAEQGTAGGGSIDIFSTVEDAKKRDKYLSRFDGGLLNAGYHTVVGTLVIRTSEHLDKEEQQTLEADIIAALTAGVDEENNTIPNTTETRPLPPAEIQSISFREESYVVGIGRTLDIPFILYPENASTDALEASLDNAEIASLSFSMKDAGIIQLTGLTPGDVTITLRSGDAIIATTVITITEVMPERMVIDAEPSAPLIGSSGVFTVGFEPLDVTDKTITWHSDAPDVLKVNEDGSFEALSVGVATVTAIHKSGLSDTINISVQPIQVTNIQISTNYDASTPFCKGNSMTLTAEITPENATDRSITWASSDTSVATVSDKGVVTAVSHGTAVITAKAANGKTGTYTVTVDPSPQKFWVSISIQMKSNDHVGYSWSTGAELNGEAIFSGTSVSIMPNEVFTVCGWAQEQDSRPDYGDHSERITLTDEMCRSGFTVEGEAWVFENGGRYSGCSAVWYVKITFTPIG